MKDLINKILIEETQKEKWEYQIRFIDSPVFYKRKKGAENWFFINAEEFAENAHKSKIVKWEKND